MSDAVACSLQSGCHTCSVGVQAVRDSAQPLGTVVHRVSTRDDGQQSLSGTDVRGSLLAADVLLTSLQGQAVGRLAGRVLRDTHQTARHGALHALVNGHVAGVRAAEEEGQAKALGVTNCDICAQFTGRLQQGQSQQVGVHRHQGVTFLSGLDERFDITDFAVLGGVSQDNAVQVALGQALGEIGDDKGNTEHLRTAAGHRNNLRQATGVNSKEAVLHLAVCTVHHNCGLSDSGSLIQQRGVSNLQAGQLHHGVLEVQQSFQATLRNLSLVGSVGSVETGVLQNIAAQNSGGHSVVVTGANHLCQDLILSGVAGNLRKSFMLRQRGRKLQLAVEANLRGDDSVHQRIQGRISQGFEHLLCVCGTGAEMTINKGHRILLLVGANRRGVTSRYCDESNALSVPHLRTFFSPLSRFDMLGDDNSSPNPHIDDSKDSLAPDTEQSKAPVHSPLPEERTGAPMKTSSDIPLTRNI